MPRQAANLSDPAPERPWPNDRCCAVFSSFDVDAESAWISYDIKNVDRLVTMSFGGYEARVGVPKLLEYLRSIELKSTFFIPGWVVETHPRMCESIMRDGHEVGHHGYLHKRPDPDDLEHDIEEIDRALEVLQRIWASNLSAIGRRPARTMTPCSSTSASEGSCTRLPSATISAPIGID